MRLIVWLTRYGGYCSKNDNRQTMEIQQTPRYIEYVKSMGWKAETLDGVSVFYRRIPLSGTFAKIHRPVALPGSSDLIAFLRARNVRTITVEPDARVKQPDADRLGDALKKAGFRINQHPYLPTKTNRINIGSSEDTIFSRFSAAKRRAVRRAIKNGLIIQESDDIQSLIRIKNQSAGFLGFITTYGAEKLWNQFRPRDASVVLAYDQDAKPSNLVGGIFLVFSGGTAYYWITGTTRHGKKLFAPTLLVWEALKISKMRKCKWFDFIGVWDERFPNLNRDWLGFTRFKEGFGGESMYYPVVR
jgi:hypothetical protein